MSGFLERLENQFTLGLRGCNAERQNDFRRIFCAGISQVRRQMRDLDPLALCENESALQDIAKLPHITRPRVSYQHLHRIIPKRLNVNGMLLVELADEVLREYGDVFLAVTKR